MPCWTTTELRRLKQVHADGQCPSREELAASFPRHSIRAITDLAWRLGIKRQHRQSAIDRLRKVHLYFQQREQGRLA